MSSTTGQIKQVKKELQQFRELYLKAWCEDEKHKLALQIKRRKELLAELGVSNG